MSWSAIMLVSAARSEFWVSSVRPRKALCVPTGENGNKSGREARRGKSRSEFYDGEICYLLSGLPQDELFIVLSELLQVVEGDGGQLAGPHLPAHRPQHVPLGLGADLVKCALGDRVEAIGGYLTGGRVESGPQTRVDATEGKC